MASGRSPRQGTRRWSPSVPREGHIARNGDVFPETSRARRERRGRREAGARFRAAEGARAASPTGCRIRVPGCSCARTSRALNAALAPPAHVHLAAPDPALQQRWGAAASRQFARRPQRFVRQLGFKMLCPLGKLTRHMTMSLYVVCCSRSPEIKTLHV
jgi:hypothetical protein